MVSIKCGLRTTDYGLQTADHGLGVKHGLGYKIWTEHYVLYSRLDYQPLLGK